MNPKHPKQLIRVLLTALACLLICLLAACKPQTPTDDKNTGESGVQGDTAMNQPDTNTIFTNGEYQCILIYPSLIETDMTMLRNELTQAFKNKTGINITAKRDDVVEYDANAFEILLGNTNRPESAAPEGYAEGKDTYYQVGKVGNKLVLGGSDAYQAGLAVQYFIEQCLSGEKTDNIVLPDAFGTSELRKDYTRPYWALNNVPAYPIGERNVVNANTYESGTTIKNYTQNGHNSTTTVQQTVTRTNADEFAAYLTKLESFGYTREYENDLEGNRYFMYYNGEHRVYLAFTPVNSTVKVIYDPAGMSLEEFGYSYTPKSGEYSEFYQYAIPMADGKTEGGLINCGMCLVIRCADNSVIVVDGGASASKQMNPVAQAGFDKFLHEITNTPESGTVRISAWYLTHYHSDHFSGFYDFLTAYGDRYQLERVIANVPTGDALNWNGVNWVVGELTKYIGLINSKYPDCKELKVHTGQDIQIADVTLRVLYTHEDLISAQGAFNSGDSNDTSTVIRVDNGKLSMLVLGDANVRTQSVMTVTFTQATLKCDILQAAHHMIYHLETVYRRVAPSIIYIPQSEGVSHSSVINDGSTYQWRRDFLTGMVGEENCYFAGDETVGYAATADGTLIRTYYKEEVIGHYDFPFIVKPEGNA